VAAPFYIPTSNSWAPVSLYPPLQHFFFFETGSHYVAQAGLELIFCGCVGGSTEFELSTSGLLGRRSTT
jgi:hypothetical protein